MRTCPHSLSTYLTHVLAGHINIILQNHCIVLSVWPWSSYPGFSYLSKLKIMKCYIALPVSHESRII